LGLAGYALWGLGQQIWVFAQNQNPEGVTLALLLGGYVLQNSFWLFLVGAAMMSGSLVGLKDIWAQILFGNE